MFDLTKIEATETPFYYYDMKLLGETLGAVKDAIAGRPFKVHYAMKANSNPEILKAVARAGFGTDCVSGGEIALALAAGVRAEDISYASVGKTDREIRQGLEAGIGCFCVESVEELGVIEEIAASMGRVAPVALRVNPNIDAHTHHYITTGLEENKFGIDMRLLDRAVGIAIGSDHLDLIGLHFHIGSQITTMEPFRILGARINDLVAKYRARGVEFRTIDVGGGLGIDYEHPDEHPIADFKGYFDVLAESIDLAPGQTICCEPGRALVAQCGSLISRVVYVKEGVGKKFVIVDAGMNDLMRPALYQAHHNIENLTARAGEPTEVYDVVGPVCESSDVFAKDERMPLTRRGDIIAMRSAGAYGESMASCYNSRRMVGSVFAE